MPAADCNPPEPSRRFSVNRQPTLTLQITGRDMILGFAARQHPQGGRVCADRESVKLTHASQMSSSRARGIRPRPAQPGMRGKAPG